MSARLDAEFPAALRTFAAAGGADPSWALLTFYCESGLDPSTHRFGTSYFGLSQLNGAWLKAHGIDPATYLGWTASKQLRDVIAPWYREQIDTFKVTTPFKSPGHMWAVNLAPARANGGAPGTVLYARGESGFDSNKPLAMGGDAITVGSVDAFMARRAQEKPFQEALAAVSARQPYNAALPWGYVAAGGVLVVGVLGVVAIVAHETHARRTNPALGFYEIVGAGVLAAAALGVSGYFLMKRKPSLVLPPAGGGYLKYFPIVDSPAAKIHFWDDFGQPRTGHTHQGNDVFAVEGTPIVAVADGSVRFVEESLGGKSFYLTDGQGNTFFGTHMRDYEGAGRTVRAGDVIGYVGHGGNAAGTPDHLHFEVHPKGQGAIDPFPYLTKAPRVSSGALLSS